MTAPYYGEFRDGDVLVAPDLWVLVRKDGEWDGHWVDGDGAGADDEYAAHLLWNCPTDQVYLARKVPR